MMQEKLYNLYIIVKQVYNYFKRFLKIKKFFFFVYKKKIEEKVYYQCRDR